MTKTYPLHDTPLEELDLAIAQTAIAAHRSATFGEKAKEAMRLLLYVPAADKQLADGSTVKEPATGLLTRCPSLFVDGCTVTLGTGTEYQYPPEIALAEEALKEMKQISKNGGGFLGPAHATAFLRLLGLQHDAAAADVICCAAPENATVELPRSADRPEILPAAVNRPPRPEFKDSRPATGLRAAMEGGPRALIRWANGLLRQLEPASPEHPDLVAEQQAAEADS